MPKKNRDEFKNSDMFQHSNVGFKITVVQNRNSKMFWKYSVEESLKAYKFSDVITLYREKRNKTQIYFYGS